MLVFSLLVVILQFQSETTKCDGPESWAVGWVLYDRLGLREAEQIKLTVEVKLGDRKATFELLLVAHLTTNVDQGDESELPLDLCPGRCHLRRISRRAKGREYTTVLPVGICQELMALEDRLQTL